ncbi:MAG: metallophosphoesterase [Patescibacteria group bacterium]
MTVWISSDYHLGHLNIIKYCKRPFANVDDMDDAIIANHNACIKPNDMWYHNGDFCYGGPGKAIEYLRRLNGQKFMIKGNHDKDLENDTVKPYYMWLKDYYELYVQDKDTVKGRQFIVLSHYAMRVWNKSHKLSWQLYGHSHASLPDDANLLSFDVGVDCHNFKPLSYYDIKAIMSKKNIKT